MDFTVQMYIELLQVIKETGYNFSTFETFLRSPLPDTVILRHDVDAMPQNSLTFAKIQHKMGLKVCITSEQFRQAGMNVLLWRLPIWVTK
jgi:hypothetical protein